MALHDYECKNCGAKFEKLDFRFDGKCPYCGSEELEQKFSTFQFYFRGAFEWYNELDKENMDAGRV